MIADYLAETAEGVAEFADRPTAFADDTTVSAEHLAEVVMYSAAVFQFLNQAGIHLFPSGPSSTPGPM